MLAVASLDDFGTWARGDGLEIVLLVLGSVLLARCVSWFDAFDLAGVAERTPPTDGLVADERADDDCDDDERARDGDDRSVARIRGVIVFGCCSDRPHTQIVRSGRYVPPAAARRRLLVTSCHHREYGPVTPG